MVEKSTIISAILGAILVASIVFNLWFYLQIHNSQYQIHKLNSEKYNLQASYEELQGEYQNLEGDYNSYRENHLYSNYDYETAREESYSKGYDDAKFNFYYVEPKNQKYGLENLKDAVREVTWTSPYEEGVFDCSEMSAYIERYLENEGFHAIILVGESPFSSGRHAWVLAETSEGQYMPIETTQPRTVLWDDEGFENYFEYDDDFETIQEALIYSQTGFDWWTVYP